MSISSLVIAAWHKASKLVRSQVQMKMKRKQSSRLPVHDSFSKGII